jgi:hypothetical protein
MREHQLLSPSRQPTARPTNPHEGSIVAEAPNQLWGTDATAAFTEEDGRVTIFAAIDRSYRLFIAAPNPGTDGLIEEKMR